MSDRDNRRISVYDLTGLRVHPNGYRVHQTTENLNLGKYGHNIQTSRGWISNDAGGSISMPRYRDETRLPSTGIEESEVFNELEAMDEDKESDIGDEDPSPSGERQRKRSRKYNNMAPIKRRKFYQDESYISSHERMTESSSAELDIPSQDLLKNIHFLAAKFYDDRGLLENTAKRYRDKRRQQKPWQTRSHSEATPKVSQGTSSPDPSDAARATSEDQDTQRGRVSRDMYRVLDGSALLAIGMLTQEMVKKLIFSKRRSSPQPIDGEDTGEDENLQVSVPSPHSFEEQEIADDDAVSDGAEERTDEIEREDESGSDG